MPCRCNRKKDQIPEKERKKSFFSRCFAPNDIFIRRKDKVTFCSLSTEKQVCLFSIFVLLAVWTVFSSCYFLYYGKQAAGREERLHNLQSAYQNLLGEVSVFQDHLRQVVSEIDKNQEAVRRLQEHEAGEAPEAAKVRRLDPFAVPEKQDALQEAERIEDDNSRLKNEILLVQGKLARLTESGVSGINAENGNMPLHKILLQRDLATSEAEALQEKVRNLEKLIANMQDTQILVFRKMASLADNNIDRMEEDLSGIRQSLAGTGLGMETLLSRIRRDKENVGIGGPFIPAPMPKMQHSSLNISLVSLNQRLDRWYDLTTLQNALPIGKPVERIRVTSPFGTRGDPFQDAPAIHEAVDLGGMTGEPIYTTAPGKVVRAGRWGWYGNMVEIDHGLGFRTRYAHMDKVFVTKGDTVRAGDRIGSVGSTGRSTGAHLHYEIRVRGQAVDPMKFIKASKNVFKN